MLKLVLRGFVQRKLRVALTAIAIALGVALMAGTYILTDTIDHSFASIFQTASKGHDVVVTPTQTLGRNVRAQTSPITDQMVATVRSTPGVAQASGSIFTLGSLLDTHGRHLTSGHAPAFIATTVPARFESFKPVKGVYPTAAGEVAIDEATAERNGLRLGRSIVVAGAAATATLRIVGIVQFGGGESFGGASAALMTPAEAQRIVGEPGRWDQIDVAAQPGVTPGELRTRIRARLPQTVDVRTGAEQASKNTSDLNPT